MDQLNKQPNGQASGQANEQLNKRQIISWVFVVVWALFIFLMSARTGSSLDSGAGIIGMIKRVLNDIQVALLGPDVDVVSSLAHFCEYAVFGVLLVRALNMNTRWKVSWKGALVLAVVIASAYGVSDEFHQYFVPGRFCDPFDWLVDTAGALLGALLYMFIQCRKKRTKLVGE